MRKCVSGMQLAAPLQIYVGVHRSKVTGLNLLFSTSISTFTACKVYINLLSLDTSVFCVIRGSKLLSPASTLMLDLWLTVSLEKSHEEKGNLV